MRTFQAVYIALLLSILPVSALGAATAEAGFEWPLMSMGLFGGLALFLYGMEKMTEALKAAAGERMKFVLEKLTGNRFTGAFTGALVTSVIQSSSVTTVLVVGFVSAGLMSLGQSIGVIMGANIGTTITAQIVAFKVTKLALLLIAVGFALLFASRHERSRTYGGIIMGLGLVFYGMNVMSEAMAPLRSYPPFLDFMMRMETPVVGIAVGGLFTALVQSSSATTGIVIVMASQGFISLPAGIALALGANVGTCITALLASLGKPRNAVRAATVHVIFNVAGVLLWLGFIDRLAELAALLSPAHPDLTGLARMASETPRQIANANTLFNVANTLVFIGFTGPLARLVTRLVPDRPRREREPVIRPKYLDDGLLSTPSLALGLVRPEIGHLGVQLQLMLAQIRIALKSRNRRLLVEVASMDDAADLLHAEVTRYLSRLAKQSLTETEQAEFFLLSHAADHFEGIGDLIEKDLVTLGQKMVLEELHPSATMWPLLNALHEDVALALETVVRAVSQNDLQAARQVLALKQQIRNRVDAALRRQAQSLAGSEETRLATLRIEFEIIDRFNRIYSLCKRVARLVMPQEG
ncbi:Na/Pi cotransporter family protein [Trichloromonas sp.]|uniref:Na/Pi cotransporter family protein n=1 Tax=Trichloromonas sp. TaxID=3069249 RepID=UPI003D816506